MGLSVFASVDEALLPARLFLSVADAACASRLKIPLDLSDLSWEALPTVEAWYVCTCTIGGPSVGSTVGAW